MFDNYQPGMNLNALSGQHTFPTQMPEMPARDPRQFMAGRFQDAARYGDPNTQGHGFRSMLNALRGMFGGHRMDGAPIPGSPAPGMPNTQFPLNPGMGGPIQGQQVPGSMVGTQLGVIGATPATSPFGLPGY